MLVKLGTPDKFLNLGDIVTMLDKQYNHNNE